jgi:hypothetical protein
MRQEAGEAHLYRRATNWRIRTVTSLNPSPVSLKSRTSRGGLVVALTDASWLLRSDDDYGKETRSMVAVTIASLLNLLEDGVEQQNLSSKGNFVVIPPCNVMSKSRLVRFWWRRGVLHHHADIVIHHVANASQLSISLS